MFTRTRLFKHKELVSNFHVCSNDLGKIVTFIYISLFYNNSNLHTYEKFNIFFAYFMSPCPTINFQTSIMTKWHAKPIKTSISFKITIGKRHIYIDNRLPWIWKQYFQLGYLKTWSYFNDRFPFISALYMVKFTEHIWNWVS